MSVEPPRRSADTRTGDPRSLSVDFGAPPESPGELAMRSRIAARLDLDIGQADQVIDRYQVLRRLGAGGMGVVYEARDPQLDRAVALKLLRMDRATSPSDGHERLRREARVLAKLSHPNVVQIHEVGEHQGMTFVVMELVRGQTLFEWQLTKERSVEEVLATYRQAGLGLAAAHRAGVVHRDFKPSNALIDEDGRVRVVDFGLSRASVVGESVTLPTPEDNSSTGIVGTPGYIAPEVLARRPATAASDQFSFCVSLWEALTGDRPSAISPSSGITAQFSGPAWLRRVLIRGLAKDPLDRWPDLPTLLRALDHRPRRQVWLLLGLPLVGLAAGLFGSHLLEESGEDPCSAQSPDFDEVWNPHTAAQLRARLMALGRTDAEAELVARALDRQRSRWLDTQQAACRATRVTASWTPQLHAAASRCLIDNLEQSRDFVAMFDPALGDPPLSVRPLIAELADPRECMDLDLLTRRSASANDDALIDLRQSLSRTRLLLAGETLRADAQTEALLIRARELRRLHPEDPSTEWVLGEALELRADAEQWHQRPERAWPLLREALPIARRSANPRLELDCLSRMGLIAAEQLEQPERAADFVAAAAGVVPLLESDPRAELQHALMRAELARSQQLLTEAEGILRTVIDAELHNEEFAGASADRARLRLANVVAEQGRLAEALQIYAELRDSLAAQLGPEAAEVGFVEFNIGLTLAQAGGREREAESHLLRAVEVLERSFGARSLRLAPALTALAELELQDGRLDEAHDHAKRAWQLQRQLPAGHGDRGQALKIIGAVHSANADHAAALPIYELMVETLQMDAEEEAALTHMIGWTKCRLSQCAAARPDFEHALARTSSDQVRLFATVGLANADIAEARPQQAIERLARLRPLLEDEFSDDDELRGEVEWLMARALVDSNADRRQARTHLRQAKAAYATVAIPPDIEADITRLATTLGVHDE
ncbi:MAG: serine/threonine-protein kinase [Enhygromyxa sp.]